MTEEIEENVVLTVQEAANFLRVDAKTIYKLVKTGEVRAAKIGRIIRIHKNALIDYLKGDTNE